MENVPEEIPMYRRIADGWGKWHTLGAAATGAVIAGATIMHQHEKSQANAEFIKQLSILNDPQQLPEGLQEDSDTALQDVNRMAAVVLHYKDLTMAAWHRKSNISIRRFDTLKLHLEKRQLTLKGKSRSNSSYPRCYPRPALEYALENLDDYPLLQQQLTALQEADGSETILS